MLENLVDKNYDWFKLNLHNLVKKYEGQYIVIKDCKVIASYSNFDEAFVNTNEQEEAGTYIIQLCSEDENKTGRTYHTLRVNFA